MPDEQNVLLLEEKSDKTCLEKPSLPCSLVWLIVCMIGIALGVGIVILIMQSADKRPMVLTTCGLVEGYYHVVPDVHVYKGIPYAAAPVGDLRWRRPVALRNGSGENSGTCWKGVLRVVEDENLFCPCLDGGNVIGSEDCLLLDVYTPSSSAHFGEVPPLVPVVVWMDAGPLLGAASVSPGVQAASRTHVVYVNVRYRLGPLGFLVADLLGDNQTANYGIWDQLEALRWIRDNIAQFGGDPKQVTLMSQSSGAASGLPLVTSPHAKGLFQRAWLLSTSTIINSTLKEAKVKAANVIANTKCLNAKCLRDLPVRDLLVAAADEWNAPFILDLPKKDQFQMPNVVIDGDLIPEDPAKAWLTKSGHYPDVPLLIGSIAHMALSEIQELKGASNGDFLDYIMTFLDTFSANLSQEAVAAYNFPDTVDQQHKLASMVADIRVGCKVNILANNAANALNSPVFRYVVTDQPSAHSSSYRISYKTQGWDSFAYFETTDNKFLGFPPSDSDLRFMHTIQMVGLHFIQTGQGGWGKAPNFTDLIADKVTLLNKDYHKVQCDFWDKAGLLDYAWMN